MSATIEEDIQDILKFTAISKDDLVASELSDYIRAKLRELGEEVKGNLNKSFPRENYPSPKMNPLPTDSMYTGAWNATRAAEMWVDAAVERMAK